MTNIKPKTSTETVLTAAPPPQQPRPKLQRSPSSSGAVVGSVKVVSQRPPMLTRPSVSSFVSIAPGSPKHAKFQLIGSCQTCMAAARDAYDQMHVDHLKNQAQESGK